jgi:ABC-2 type transport system ATP-binding protein
MSAGRHDGETTLLNLRGIRRNWGDRPVIAGADLTLHRGSIAWIGGANGAGKTTLLRVVAGLLTADGGEVSLLGLDPERNRRDYQRRLGWLPAGNAGVYNRLSVRRNVTYAASIAFVTPSQRTQAVETALAQLDLERLAATRADRISMGERQRLRLAMTLVHEPELVLLDEPHTSLDDDALDRLRTALRQLTARGGAAVWCSPSREGIGLPASDKYVLRDGRLAPC